LFHSWLLLSFPFKDFILYYYYIIIIWNLPSNLPFRFILDTRNPLASFPPILIESPSFVKNHCSLRLISININSLFLVILPSDNSSSLFDKECFYHLISLSFYSPMVIFPLLPLS
jgi:hypothetical protein